MPALREAEVAPSSSSTIVNGINVTDLFALIEGVKRDASTGTTSWRVTTTWQGQTRSRSQVEAFRIGGQRVPRRFSIDIDEPRELGGGDAFANPQEHLLAALNACMTVGYVAQCAVRGITIEKLEFGRACTMQSITFKGKDFYDLDKQEFDWRSERPNIKIVRRR